MHRVLVLSGSAAITWAMLMAGCSGDGGDKGYYGAGGGPANIALRSGGNPGAGGTAVDGRITGGVRGSTGGRYGLGGYPIVGVGGYPATSGGRAMGGNNNPAGCPATLPANR